MVVTTRLWVPAIALMAMVLLAVACGGGGGTSDAEPEPTIPRVGVGECTAPCMELMIPNADCTDTWPAVHCTVQTGAPFSLKIIGRVPDPSQIGGFATLVYMDGLTYTAKDCGQVEILFRPVTIPLCALNATGAVGHGNVGLGSPFAPWTNAPDLVAMPEVVCETAGTHDIILTAALPIEPSPAGGAKFKGVDGSDVLLNTAGYERRIEDPRDGPVTIDPADILTVSCV